MRVELLGRFRKADGLLETNLRFAHPAHIICCPAFYEWHGFGTWRKGFLKSHADSERGGQIVRFSKQGLLLDVQIDPRQALDDQRSTVR